MEINIQESGIGDNVRAAIEGVSEIGISMIDNATEDEEISRIDAKYRYSEPGIGAMTTTGGEYWRIIDLTKYLVTIGAFWIFQHVVQDIDDAIWEKFKSVISRIVKSLRGKKTKKETIVLLTHYPEGMQHEIAFVFTNELTDSELASCFRTMGEAIKKNKHPTSEPGPTLTIFKFDKRKGQWEKAASEV